MGRLRPHIMAVRRLVGASVARTMFRCIQGQAPASSRWSGPAPLRVRLCSSAVAPEDISKTVLIDIYKQIGNEARQVMLESEARIREEVDQKLSQGMDMDLAASMYGHQMAAYMAEFLPLPDKNDSVVQRIRDSVISNRGVTSAKVDEAFKVFEKDHEVQLVLTTMYQHRLDEATLPEHMNLDKYIELTQALQDVSVAAVEKLNENINSRASEYMTENQKKELDGARQAVPTIAVFTAQYQALHEAGVSYQDKLLADLMFAVWPKAQQANAQLQQAIQDAQLRSSTTSS